MEGTSTTYNAVVKLEFILKGLIVYDGRNWPNFIKRKGKTRDFCWLLKQIVKDFVTILIKVLYRGGDVFEVAWLSSHATSLSAFEVCGFEPGALPTD